MDIPTDINNYFSKINAILKAEENHRDFVYRLQTNQTDNHDKFRFDPVNKS